VKGPPREVESDVARAADATFAATVPESLAGVRVDRAVALLTGVTRSGAAELVARGRVLLDGLEVRTRSRPLVAGAVLTVDLPRRQTGPEPDATVPLAIVHEDAALVVVDKPPGIVVHPGAGAREGTLVQGLLARYPDIASAGDPGRPGIVHRLDRGTSGLLVVARTADAYDSLTAQLASRSVGRRYLALVAGHVPEARGAVEAPIGRSARTPTRMTVATSGRPARTTYEVLRRLDTLAGRGGGVRTAASYLACTLDTGRTHQIRVHMAAIGHPVLGDDRYGRPPGGVLRRGRLFLHAAELALDHPVTGERTAWRSPLPADLAEVLGAG
jgi:23S rRNA pseudouridine1911/1915/1917 synthase